MRFLYIPILLLMISVRLSAQIEPTDTDNNGFRNISTAEEILWISQNPDSWQLNYELDNDIDLSDSKNWNAGLGFSPIGNSAHPFSGQFDGHDFLLSFFTIYRPNEDTLGFFGVVSKTAEIRNLKFTVSEISGNSYVGIICGVNSGLIEYVYAGGTITAQKDYVGGFAGINYGIMQYDKSDIEITGIDAYYGGITGENQGTISSSSSIGKIQSKYIIGGLVGINSGAITNCYSRVDILAQENYIGGFAGSNWENGTITNCYSTGFVRGSGYYQGGLVGFKSNESKDFGCFWDTDSSEIYESMGGDGKTSDEMRNINTYSSVNWDFSSIWVMSPKVNDGYPYLQNKPISVKENEVSTLLSIYPNPANNQIIINLCVINPTLKYGVDDSSSILIYNTLGEKVIKVDTDRELTTRIDISVLPKGVYFAVIYQSNQMCSQSFVKN